jgi:hypothetical protein
MQQQFAAANIDDEQGNPAGGYVRATGLTIEWQDGPLGRGDERVAPNGAFVETVIAAAMQRLQYYQSGRFACGENRDAISYLESALQVLNARTAARENRGVEGTHEI